MKLYMKLYLSVLILVVFGGFSAIYAHIGPSSTSLDETGVVTIVVIDDDGRPIIEKEYAFTAADTLADILKTHHDARYESHALFGRKLLALAGIETDFQTDFIEISIDGVPARVGIDRIPLEDGRVYTFVHKGVNGTTPE